MPISGTTSGKWRCLSVVRYYFGRRQQILNLYHRHMKHVFSLRSREMSSGTIPFHQQSWWKKVLSPAGFEPATFVFTGRAVTSERWELCISLKTKRVLFWDLRIGKFFEVPWKIVQDSTSIFSWLRNIGPVLTQNLASGIMTQLSVPVMAILALYRPKIGLLPGFLITQKKRHEVITLSTNSV